MAFKLPYQYVAELPRRAVEQLQRNFSELERRLGNALQSTDAGHQIRWGSNVGSTDASGNIAITFDPPFESAPQCIVATNGDRNQGAFYFAVIQTPTVSGATLRAENAAGTAIASTLIRFNWVAISTA